jgi:hypothetical protein
VQDCKTASASVGPVGVGHVGPVWANPAKMANDNAAGAGVGMWVTFQ